jgi:hypothetical protein
MDGITVRASIAHLHARVVIQKQRHRKTHGRATNRWTLQDITAVEKLLGEIDRAARVAARDAERNAAK